jgi:hypothetical protein
MARRAPGRGLRDRRVASAGGRAGGDGPVRRALRWIGRADSVRLESARACRSAKPTLGPSSSTPRCTRAGGPRI